jgi:RodZ C-terminal domain
MQVRADVAVMEPKVAIVAAHDPACFDADQQSWRKRTSAPAASSERSTPDAGTGQRPVGGCTVTLFRPGSCSRPQPPRGASPPRARACPGGGRDMHPDALPAGPRGRALRTPPGLGLRQGLPSRLRRLPRPGQSALRRRVQRALQRGRDSAGTAPARAATSAAAVVRHRRHRPPRRARRRAACVAAEQLVTAARPLARSLGASGRSSCPGHPAQGATRHTPRQPTDEAGRRGPRAPRHRGPCWLSVRQRSEQGRHLFEGTLEPGDSHRFADGQLWIRIGAPWNLEASRAGRRLSLPQTVANVVVTASGIRTLATR